MTKDDKPDKLVEEWKIEEVVEWSAKYIDREAAIKLQTQKINGKALLKQNAVSLERCGIPIGPESILAEEIEKLKAPQGIQLDNQNFAWAEPHPLLQTSGRSWDYQESQNLKQKLKEDLESHYHNWQQKITDKGRHPLFLALIGAGTGKSRLLQEFPRLSREVIGENTELSKRLKNAYVFNISFENGTPLAIANRMLYQLFQDKKFGFDIEVRQLPRNVTPEKVIQFFSEIEGRNLEDMTVFLL